MRQLEQNAWVFTDPHFLHHRLVECGDRPEGFEDLIASNWLRRVGPEDVVYCLGDVAFKVQAEAHQKFIMAMPGYKILIRGNHDKQKDAWYLTHGWSEVHTTLLMATTVKGRHTRLLLSHEPQAVDNTWDINLHGHLHNNLHRIDDEMKAFLTPKHRLLSIEQTNYEMVRMDDFLHGRVQLVLTEGDPAK